MAERGEAAVMAAFALPCAPHTTVPLFLPLHQALSFSELLSGIRNDELHRRPAFPASHLP